MRILKTAESEYRITLTPAEARIFVNCMKLAIKEIATREFGTRVGATPEEITTVIAALEAALK